VCVCVEVQKWPAMLQCFASEFCKCNTQNLSLEVQKWWLWCNVPDPNLLFGHVVRGAKMADHGPVFRIQICCVCVFRGAKMAVYGPVLRIQICWVLVFRGAKMADHSAVFRSKIVVCVCLEVQKWWTMVQCSGSKFCFV